MWLGRVIIGSGDFGPLLDRVMGDAAKGLVFEGGQHRTVEGPHVGEQRFEAAENFRNRVGARRESGLRGTQLDPEGADGLADAGRVFGGEGDCFAIEVDGFVGHPGGDLAEFAFSDPGQFA